MLAGAARRRYNRGAMESGPVALGRTESQVAELSGADRDLSALRDLCAALLCRVGHAEALNRIAAAIGSSLDMDAVLKAAVNELVTHLDLSYAHVTVYSDDKSGYTIDHLHEAHSPAYKPPMCAPSPIVPCRLAEELAEQQLSFTVFDCRSDPRTLGCSAGREMDVRSFLGVPLVFKGQLLGALCLLQCDRERHWSDEEVSFAQAAARQLALAVQNTRLYRNAQRLAVLEERERIAREMHDGLAQALGYIYMNLQALEQKLQGGETVSGINDLRLVRSAAAEAYEEVRQAIFGLRSSVSRGMGLVPILTEYLHDYSERNGIAVQLVVNDELATRLAPEAEVQLIRIIQEALANVRKHSRARKASVQFSLAETTARIVVEDDGEGFDPAEVLGEGRLCFGRETMRERAESVGGTLRIESSRGQGTRVIATLPVATQSWPLADSWRR